MEKVYDYFLARRIWAQLVTLNALFRGHIAMFFFFAFQLGQTIHGQDHRHEGARNVQNFQNHRGRSRPGEDLAQHMPI